MHNFVQIQIKVNDFSIAKDFYGSIFNWFIYQSEDMDNVMFYRVDEQEEQVGGSFLLTDQVPKESAILLYVNTDNIDKTISLIEEKGGTIILPKTPLPGNHGFISRFKDPFGTLMGIWSEE